jgi:hypothetical protein
MGLDRTPVSPAPKTVIDRFLEAIRTQFAYALADLYE